MSSDIEAYIFDLSRELNIENTHGVIGNELELIALVRNCPFIYDKARNDFKDIQKREATWRAIAAVMHCSVTDCQSRWKSLREQYGKIKRAISTNDPEVSRWIQWEFLEDMKFLDQHIKPRRKFLHYSNSGEMEPMMEEDDDNYKIEWLEEKSFDNRDNRELKLINLVKNCPLIYNKHNMDSKDVNKKEQAWISIAKVLGCPDCKTRWKTLRERYARERRMQIEDPNRKSWDFFEELSFLNSHVKPRRSSYRPILPKPDFTTYIKAADSSIVATSTLLEGNQGYQVQKMEFIDTSYQPVESTDPIIMSPNSAVSQNSDLSRQENSMKNDNTNAQSSVTSQDEDDLFGQSIAAELKRMTGRRKKMRLKADIFKLLCEAESDSN